ncbi:glycosyltransferase, partial [bacterium]|nr:glycosyltransferase [bacterium]MCK4325269.1 glycosyltransferase [bacterium]
MKIALIRQNYHKYGGAERYVYHLSQELARRGHEVHIFAHTGKDEVNQLNRPRKLNVPNHLNKAGQHKLVPQLNKVNNSANPITFHRVPIFGGAGFLRTLSFALFSRWRLKKDKFDIIHSFDRTFYQDIYRAGDGCHREWLSHSLKIASNGLSRMMIRLNPLHLTLLFLERRIFKKCKKIIAIAKIGREEIIRSYQINPERITVVYNGVDSE